MSVWTLLQIVFNLFILAGFSALWLRLRRPPQDDPRLSRGLQLLQTKITVLEDLSDRTDSQVKQLTALLDQKNRMLQNKLIEAEQQILKIDHSMNKSLEVAEIFQDKIPHQEIVERQRTVEYVRAARMAHSGLSLDEIAEKVSLPREQLELIVKFNREQLMFDENALPEWATRESEGAEPSFALSDMNFLTQPEVPEHNPSDVKKIENEFRAAVEQVSEAAQTPNHLLMDSKVAETLKASVAGGMESMQPAVMSLKATAQTLREKLVSTAEDLLRAQNQGALVGAQARATVAYSANVPRTTESASNSAAANLIGKEPAVKVLFANGQNSPANSAPQVRKVVFPRIEK